MHNDESNRAEARALTPEEVGSRVSAILEAAERDARAVIDAAHRELATRECAAPSLEQLAASLDALTARVEGLERAQAAGLLSAATPATPPRERRERRGVIDPASRVRAIELALAGYSRAAIAEELAESMAPGDIDVLLDEVLSR
jgi:hypothetical protein